MFTQLIRIGRDSEIRYTKNGKAVCSIAGAYDVGHGDNKKTQWIDCALWDKRAESLAPYLVKGQQCMVTLDDVYIHSYEGHSGPKSTLKARVVDIKFCGSNPTQAAKPQQQDPQRQEIEAKNRDLKASQEALEQQADYFHDDIPF